MIKKPPPAPTRSRQHAHDSAFEQDHRIVEMLRARPVSAPSLPVFLRVRIIETEANTISTAKSAMINIGLLTVKLPRVNQRVGNQRHQPCPRSVHCGDRRNTEDDRRFQVDEVLAVLRPGAHQAGGADDETANTPWPATGIDAEQDTPAPARSECCRRRQ
jgi:hypothetical protein